MPFWTLWKKTARRKSICWIKNFFTITSFFVVVLSGGCGHDHTDIIRVAAAANTIGVMEAVKEFYEKDHSGATVEISFGSSGALTAQILNGAPYDLFLAADMAYPQKIPESCAAGPVLPYARGVLILLWPGPAFTSPEQLTDAAIKHVALANPDLAPYGRAAMEVLYSLGLQSVLAKAVYGDNVSQTYQFSRTGQTAAFMALSQVSTPISHGGQPDRELNYQICSPELYAPVIQGALLLKNGRGLKEAAALLDFLLSDKGQEFFNRFGYGPVNKIRGF